MFPNWRLGTVLLKNTNDRNFQLIVWWDRKLKVPPLWPIYSFVWLHAAITRTTEPKQTQVMEDLGSVEYFVGITSRTPCRREATVGGKNTEVEKSGEGGPPSNFDRFLLNFVCWMFVIYLVYIPIFIKIDQKRKKLKNQGRRVPSQILADFN